MEQKYVEKAKYDAVTNAQENQIRELQEKVEDLKNTIKSIHKLTKEEK